MQRTISDDGAFLSSRDATEVVSYIFCKDAYIANTGVDADAL
jgi:hypothetical protein